MRRSEIRSLAANSFLPGYSPSYSRRQLDALVEEARRHPPAPYVPPAWELGPPPAVWLYVSKRLELVAVPNEPLWCSPVLVFGASAVLYRLSPAVLHWLDVAGRALESRYEAGVVGRDQVEAYLDAMRAVWAFAAGHLDPTACEAAKGFEPRLPGLPDAL